MSSTVALAARSWLASASAYEVSVPVCVGVVGRQIAEEREVAAVVELDVEILERAVGAGQRRPRALGAR